MIERKIEQVNSIGEIISRYEKICSTWAQIIDENTITIRYRKILVPGWRVVIDDQNLEIAEVIDVRQKTRLMKLILQPITERRRFSPMRTWE